MGKKVRRVVGVVAMVAAPFAAPVIAGKLGVSSLIGKSLIGAGIGAAGSRAAGGRLSQGAIGGLLSTGISQGLQGMQAAQTAQGADVANAGLTAGQASGPAAGLGEAANMGVNSAGVPNSIAAAPPPPAGIAAPGVAGGAAPAVSGGAGMTPSWISGAGSTPSTLGTQASTGFLSTLQRTGSALMNRVADPRALAQLVVQTATPALMGDGMSSEQREMMQIARAEMEELRQRDEESYNERMAAARQVLSEARNIDPEQEGRLRQGQMQMQAGRQQRQNERAAGLRAGRPIDESIRARQNAIQGQLAGESAFQGGQLSGQQRRLAGISTGAGLIPNAPTAALSNAQGMFGPLGNIENQRRQDATAMGDLTERFGRAFGLWDTQPDGGTPT